MTETVKKAPKPKPKVMRIKVSSLRLDGGTQARVRQDPDMLESVREGIRAEAKIPPIVAFEDPENNRWLADGFTRTEGYRLEGKEKILAEVHEGTLRDARLYAAGANAVPGPRVRTTEDKQQAVLMLLDDEECRKWSDRSLAQQAKVSPTFVAKVRALSTVHVDSSTRIGLDGKERPATRPDGNDASQSDAGVNGISTVHVDSSPATDDVSDTTEPTVSNALVTDTGDGGSDHAESENGELHRLEREPGDDTDEIEQAKAAEKTRPRNGKVLYDWKVFHDAFGKLLRQIDVVGNAYGKASNGMPYKDTPTADALRRQLSEFKANFEEWVELLKKNQRQTA